MNTRRRLLVISTLVIGVGGIAATLDAHDLFLRPRDFVVTEGTPVEVRVLNGTFTSSEGVVTPDRLRDLSVAGPDGVSHPERSGWTATGKESAWRLKLGGAGTYVLGASLSPKTIKLTGAQFSEYLREDGLPDMLAARKKAGISATPAHERYAKHVKAMVRVTGKGAPPADTGYRTVFGYPAELVPLTDPYTLKPGGALAVRALVEGAPAVRQVILSGGRAPNGARFAETSVRTDANGRARILIPRRGTWYVKFIHMVTVPAGGADSVTHESKWATLTFAMP